MLETPKSIKIFNEFNPPVAEGNPVGDGLIDVYDYVVNKDTGEVEYKVVGKSNLYELIQTSKDSTDIHYIVDRVSKGDKTLLEARRGIYADVTEMPKDVFELESMSNNIRNVYQNDAILKSLYPTYEDYEKAFMNGKVFDAYIQAVQKINTTNKPVEEVKENETQSE